MSSFRYPILFQTSSSPSAVVLSASPLTLQSESRSGAAGYSTTLLGGSVTSGNFNSGDISIASQATTSTSAANRTGFISIAAATATTGASGGFISISGGSSTGTSGSGGAVSIFSGTVNNAANSTGNAGNISIGAGNVSSTTAGRTAGSITLTSGSAAVGSLGTPGNFIATAGNSAAAGTVGGAAVLITSGSSLNATGSGGNWRARVGGSSDITKRGIFIVEDTNTIAMFQVNTASTSRAVTIGEASGTAIHRINGNELILSSTSYFVTRHNLNNSFIAYGGGNALGVGADLILAGGATPGVPADAGIRANGVYNFYIVGATGVNKIGATGSVVIHEVNGGLSATGQVRAASLGVGNSAAATTLGTVTKKIEVFDASGVSLGFVAVYDAIT